MCITGYLGDLKAKTTHPDASHTFRNLDVFRMPNGGGDKTTVYGDTPRTIFAGKTANQYTIAYKSMAAASVENPAVTKASDSIALVKHQWDPIDISTADGTEAITFKYAAFYATEAEAQLEAQYAPTGLTGVMPSAMGGKGKITGVNDTMEYTLQFLQAQPKSKRMQVRPTMSATRQRKALTPVLQHR